jgi:energy-coupling factor transporter ATP-binding protein EcfA2
LTTLQGQACIKNWQDENLLAVQIPGAIDNLPINFRQIIRNKNADYRRELGASGDLALAVVNAKDIVKPEDLDDPSATCWIKMSEISIEGLRQAFLDPNSRIRLFSDPVPEEHAELLAMAWQGGFLDESKIHFNENLNVLIGGRGTGKSTVIESLRYVLDTPPSTEEARKVHEGIIRNVLKSGTKISLLVASYRPAKCEYRIERTVPNPPVVRDDSGNVLKLRPEDIFPHVEIYGQHEISELTKSKEKLTRLLERFVEKDDSLVRRKVEVKRELEKSRRSLLETKEELKHVAERLAALPAIEETLKTYKDAGLEDRLKEQSLLIKEERVLKTAFERLVPFKELHSELQRNLPVDQVFLSDKALEGLPRKDLLAAARTVFENFDQGIGHLNGQFGQTLRQAEEGLETIQKQWKEKKQGVQAEYEKILRELQKTRVDGAEFIRLRRQIEELRPLRERQSMLRKTEQELESRRRNLLSEWEEVTGAEYRSLDRAAKKVNRKLAEKVRAQVIFAGNREPLLQLLRDRIGGNLAKTIETLGSLPSLSLRELADACRSGEEALREKYDLTPMQAKNIADASPEVFMLMEEQDLPPITTLELNVAAVGQPPVWQKLEDLSTGQKATAVLLLLLLESEAPLVVDQPEDDLDNRFITEGIVPKMRDEKRRRQFLFATHNANIPVLGDAELILGLSASGEAGQGRTEIKPEHMGSIDSAPVRDLVEEVLEGGRTAFETRRLKYGF